MHDQILHQLDSGGLLPSTGCLTRFGEGPAGEPPAPPRSPPERRRQAKLAAHGLKTFFASCDEYLLHWDRECWSADPGRRKLQRCGRTAGLRHVKIQPVEVLLPRPTDLIDHLNRLPADSQVDRRIHNLQWTRWKRHARIDAGTC